MGISIVALASLFYFDSTKDYSQTILSNCGTDARCIWTSLTELSKIADRETVLSTYSSIIEPYQDSPCHHLGHKLGWFMYDYTENLAEALSLIDRTCGGSIYHGVMQQYFSIPLYIPLAIPPSEIVAINACNELVDVSYSQTRLECAHGVGHGLVISYNYDTLTAMKKCDLFEDELAQRHCVEGTMMENDNMYLSNKIGAIDEDDILFPCNTLEDKYAEPCYHTHSIWIMYKAELSVEGSFEECDKLKNENYVKHCYYGIGMMGSFDFFNNFEILSSTCQKGDLNFQTHCFAGAAYSVADQMGINQSFKFCELVPDMFQSNCYETLGKWIHTIYFTEEEIEIACSQVKNTEYYQVCINANPEELGLI